MFSWQQNKGALLGAHIWESRDTLLMKNLKKNLAGAIFVAGTALVSQPAHACSDAAETLLGATNGLLGAIPNVGPAISFLGDLITGFSCSRNGQTIDVMALMTEVAQAEISQAQQAEVANQLSTIQDKVVALQLALGGTGDAAIADFNIQDITEILGDLDTIIDNISAAEDTLQVALVTRVNGRDRYDLDIVYVLGNMKLSMLQLRLAIVENSGAFSNNTIAAERSEVVSGAQATLDDMVGNPAIPNRRFYLQEADRMRKVDGFEVTNKPGHSEGGFMKVQMTRNGVAFGEKRSRFVCGNMTFAPCKEEIRSVSEKLFSEMRKDFAAEFDLDLETNFALLQAKAEAVVADPYASLDDVVMAPPEKRFLLGHKEVNRCITFLDNKKIFTESCDLADSRQNWVFTADGRIRSRYEDRCLERATPKKVFAERCNDNKPTQIWRLRSSDRLTGVFEGENHCLVPKNGNPQSDRAVRHRPCKDESFEKWAFFTTLENLHDSLDTTAVTSAGFGEVPTPRLCVKRAGNNVVLEQCDRYRTDFLWATVSGGRLLSGRRSGMLGVPGNTANPIFITNNFAEAVTRFDRLDLGDGTFALELHTDPSQVLFSSLGATGDDASVVLLGPPPQDAFGLAGAAVWR